MKSLSAYFFLILLAGVVSAVFYGGYLAIIFLWNIYSELDLVIRIVLLSSMTAVLIASIIISAAVKSAAQTINQGHLIEAKLELYKLLIKLYQQCITIPKQPAQQDKTEILSSLNELESELLILASSSVLSVHGKLKAGLHETIGREKLDALLQQLIKSIRYDLGHGQSYDETKLKFLISPAQLKNNHHSDSGVSH